jgi:hypothetical protein
MIRKINKYQKGASAPFFVANGKNRPALIPDEEPPSRIMAA